MYHHNETSDAWSRTAEPRIPNRAGAAVTNSLCQCCVGGEPSNIGAKTSKSRAALPGRPRAPQRGTDVKQIKCVIKGLKTTCETIPSEVV
jgi:hypothetical protein